MSVLPPSDRDRLTVNRITGPGDMSAVRAVIVAMTACAATARRRRSDSAPSPGRQRARPVGERDRTPGGRRGRDAVCARRRVGAAQPGVRTGHGLPPVGGHRACRLGARLPPGSRAPVSGRARRPGDGLPEPARSRCSRVPHRVVRRVGGGDAGAVGAARDAEPGHAPARGRGRGVPDYRPDAEQPVDRLPRR